jgi:integrase
MNFVQPIRDPNIINEVKKYLEKRSERAYMLFITGIHTGLRISDILIRKVSDVRGKTHIILREKKNRKQKQIIINPYLKRELKKYIEGKDDNEYLFPSRQRDKNGLQKPIGREMAYKILREVAREFSLEQIGTHTLRKTFGYHMYLQERSTAMLMDIFGHSEEYITLRYIGVNQDAIDKAMNKFRL